MKVSDEVGRIVAKSTWAWLLVGNALAWALIVMSGWQVAALLSQH